MDGTLVDSNVLLDIITEDPDWFDWSGDAFAQCADDGRVFINPIVYGEISIRYLTIEELDDVLTPHSIERLALPFEAAFLAGKAFAVHKKKGGARTSILPDFLIGAHAAIAGLRLLTRDATRYRTYFPTLEIIAPKQAY